MTKGNQKSISDDDLCSTCKRCNYQPGELSSCDGGFPGQANADGYITDCADFAPSEDAGADHPPQGPRKLPEAVERFDMKSKFEISQAKKLGLELQPSVNGPYLVNASNGQVVASPKSPAYRHALYGSPVKAIHKDAQTIGVYSRDGASKGTARSAGYRCSKAGCTGRRLVVKWPEGATTRPCTKGMFYRPDGDWQIG